MLQQLLAPLLSPLLDKVLSLIPDKNAREKAKEDFEKDLLKIVAQADQQQADINKIEAAHSNLFVAGWRPFIGWVGGFAIFYAYIGHPFLSWGIIAFDNTLPALPVIETDMLFQLILGMLGMGGLRTFEKVKGVARSK